MEKVAPQEPAKTAPGAGVSARKRSAPIQKPVTKRGRITQAQADAAVRHYFSQVQAK